MPKLNLKLNLTEKEKEELTAIFNSKLTHASYKVSGNLPKAKKTFCLYDYAWLIYELERRYKNANRK